MPIALDASGARDLLRSAGHDPSDLVLLSGGAWSTAFAFREGGRDLVVRFHERRDDLEKDRFAQRWTTAALRTPRMLEIHDLPEGAYGISERVHGTPLDDLDETGMRRVLPSLLAALDATRDADVSGTSGYGLWHGDGTADHVTWRDNLVREDPPGERARQRELLPFCPEDRHLVHNDLLHFNVLVDAQRVVLLDWGASIFGDFLYDAALLTFWWPWYPKWSGIDIRAEIERHHAKIGLAIPAFAERLRCCELDIGVSHIHYQAAREEWANCAWTARRTAALAKA